jgi:pyruvate dehydrogenase E2 component (dihydrolipoamide acetyltransferase)
MTIMTFDLPDLGEGLADAEIVTWHVKEGDAIETGDPLAAVETAKAVVDVPSPYTGSIAKLYAKEGDVIDVHSPLVDFETEGDETSAPRSSGKAKQEKKTAVPAPTEKSSTEAMHEDSGTVVGSMPTAGEDLEDRHIIRRQHKSGAHPKAAPTARARAKALGVELSEVAASGHRGQITAADVEQHAASVVPATPDLGAPPVVPAKPVRYGTPEPIRGPRRAMAQSMSRSRDQITPTSLFDDADIHYWQAGQDITARIVRALVAGCRSEPCLNAWFNAEQMTRTIHKQVDLALAVDTPDGLIVPVVRGVEAMNGDILRHQLNRLKQATRERTVSPQDMRNPTITLSNFGMLAGRYASPIIVPPQVTIIGTGGIRHDVVPVMGGIEVHKRIPLSLTFDHRAVTGGEACRFLAALIKDLQRPF